MHIPDATKKQLLSLARQAVDAKVKGKPAPGVDQPEGLLAERLGCFVTLKNAGRLRGCIGTFQPDRPLGEMIVRMGAAAASDPRFVHNPITSYEMPELTVEVSVLSPLEPTDQPENLQAGTHGIYVVSQGRSGCYLPEVASELGWDAEQFLTSCCAEKAGLPPDAWKRPEATVYLFTSEKFSEGDV
jgi:AmmeMemoRadiSam system protein A